MKLFWAIVTATLLTAPAAMAVSPTQGKWNRDLDGTAGPVLPISDYNNKKTIGVSGTVTMTCPTGTGQFSTASANGAHYEVRRNLNGAACPAGDVTDGSAGDPRPNGRTWVPETTDLTFCGVSGTLVYLSCWSYKKP